MQVTKPAALVSDSSTICTMKKTAPLVQQIDLLLDALLMQQLVVVVHCFPYVSESHSNVLSNKYQQIKICSHGCLAHLVTVKHNPLTEAKPLENLDCKRSLLDRLLWLPYFVAQSASLLVLSQMSLHLPRSTSLTTNI